MTLIFVDRRKSDKDKAAPNRQKLIKRVQKYITQSVPRNLGNGGVTGSKPVTSSPARISASALEEPFFAYARKNKEDTLVIFGNDMYDRGDYILFPEDDSDQGTGGGNGSDDFIINIARDEFLELFFDDCELPNLVNDRLVEKTETQFQQAGYTMSGIPAQLSVIRSYKQSLGRRKASIKPIDDKLAKLKEQLENLDPNSKEAIDILKQISELENRRKIFNSFDKSDMRYRKKEAKPFKTVDAVLIMCMDISGSMDQQLKTLARTWFALMYAFIKRKYSSTELVFIAHTDDAFEMSEDDFFSTRVNGSTRVSPALHLINDIINERYDPTQTNIYVCHASDGDNAFDDDELVQHELSDRRLLDKTQMFSYIETVSNHFMAFKTSDTTELWGTYVKANGSSPTNGTRSSKILAASIESVDDCYEVFKKMFKRQQ